jgi:GT2 family glycosyltransferase
VAEAAGEYIVWTDDDVIVDREWLNTYLGAFGRWPEAVLFGGKTLPLFDGKAPGWLEESFDVLSGVFAFRDFGDAPLRFTLEGRMIPFGSNYAVRERAP